MAEENNNQRSHSKVMEYVYMGIAIGIGAILTWDITTTNDNTKAINDIVKDISGQEKDHNSEVGRSSKVDTDQEVEIKENEVELARQLTLIHDNHNTLGILLDRSDRALPKKVLIKGDDG